MYGVEIVPPAIEDARRNARRNGIENAEFYVGKAEEVLPRKYEEEGIRADVIVVDPPRKGCEPEVLDTMLQMKPERIVYVSCDSATLARDLKILRADVIVVDPPRKGCEPEVLDTMLQMKPERIVYVSCDSATLARDLKILCEKEYKIEKVAVCDMFGNSVHVETVCKLVRK